VKTGLVALTHHEAGRIARSFSMILMSNATAGAAVDEHIRGFVALTELDREYRWFRPMMVAIASELLSGVAWGVKVSREASAPELLAASNPAHAGSRGHRSCGLVR
jgi:hypothetical protein